MTKLHISEELALPLDTVTSTLVVYGGKGMGKTNLGSVLVEELSKARLRWSALDPLGVWWGLRHSKDGKGRGIECVILGGAHGDIPIEPTGGSVAADLVVDEPANVIIDFSRKANGDMWSIGEKVRFVTEYALRLFQRQGGLSEGRRREPIFQILDEAARYIPQVIPSGAVDLARCVGAWETLVEEGRNIGIGVGLLTQRSARMNKSVSEVADAMLSFRIVGPNSIGAVMDWMGEHVAKEKIKAHIETLRKLPRGSCLVVSPGWLQFEDIVRIRERETFDSSATPKPGERPKRVTGEAAKPDLAKYAERMKETIERVKENDPKELKRKIAELQKQMASQKPAAPIVEQKIVEVSVLRDEQIAELRQVVQEVSAVAAIIGSALERAQKRPALPAVQPVRTQPKPTPIPADARVPRASVANNGDLSGPEQKIIKALGELLSIGKESPSREMVAAWARYSPLSSAFSNPLGGLRTKALITYPTPGAVALTAEGRAVVGKVEMPDQEEIWRRIDSICSGPERKILRALIDHANGDPLDRDTLAEKAGYSPISSAFSNPLGGLRTKGLLDYPQPGAVRASDWLFLESA